MVTVADDRGLIQVCQFLEFRFVEFILLDKFKNFVRLFQIDASGECTVEYKVHGNHITKHKSDCKNLEIAGQFYNVNPVSTWISACRILRQIIEVEYTTALTS